MFIDVTVHDCKSHKSIWLMLLSDFWGQKVSAGGRMSQCTLCGHLLDRSAPRKKTFCNAATETDLLNMGADSMVHPAKLNSNGTLVGLSSKTNFISSTKDLVWRMGGVCNGAVVAEVDAGGLELG